MKWTGRGDTRCVDDLPRMDVRVWAKKGRTEPGQHFGESWSRMGSPSIRLDVRVHLGYFHVQGERRFGDKWIPIEVKIGRRFTKCHFGGRRIWFECHRCGLRAAILYVDGVKMHCRRCADLPYRVQCENTTDRLIRRLQKLRKRLGAPANLLAPVPWKRPYKRWEPFLRLYYEEAEVRRELFDRWKKEILDGYSVTQVYLNQLKRGGTWDD